MMNVHTDFSQVDVDEMQRIFAFVGWKRHDRAIINQIYQASTHAVFVHDGTRLVGFGRAMSDGVFNAAIYDVVVHPEYQGKGVGRLIVERLRDDLGDISCVHLVSTTGNEAFYRKLGFKRMKTAMARYLNSALDAEYLE